MGMKGKKIGKLTVNKLKRIIYASYIKHLGSKKVAKDVAAGIGNKIGDKYIEVDLADLKQKKGRSIPDQITVSVETEESLEHLFTLQPKIGEYQDLAINVPNVQLGKRGGSRDVRVGELELPLRKNKHKTIIGRSGGVYINHKGETDGWKKDRRHSKGVSRVQSYVEFTSKSKLRVYNPGLHTMVLEHQTFSQKKGDYVRKKIMRL